MPLKSVIKHLPGHHPQKRHAWRYGASMPSTMRRMSDTPLELEEYKLRYRKLQAGKISDRELVSQLRKVRRYGLADGTSLADEWLKRNSKKSPPYKMHGMDKEDTKVREVTYRGVKILYPDTVAGRKIAAESIAMWERRPMKSLDEARTVPDVLMKQAGTIAFTTQPNKADEHWAKTYGLDKFESAATGGDGNVVVYRGKAIGRDLISHELAHNLDSSIMRLIPARTAKAKKLVGSLKRMQALHSNFKKNKPNAERPIRQYGEYNAKEDFATSMELYVTRPAYMRERYPDKFEAMDMIMRNM